MKNPITNNFAEACNINFCKDKRSIWQGSVFLEEHDTLKGLDVTISLHNMLYVKI